MEAFLQTYGVWIVFGLFIILMLRMHSGHGMHSTRNTQGSHGTHGMYGMYGMDTESGDQDRMQHPQHIRPVAEESADRDDIAAQPVEGSFASMAPRTMSAVQPPTRELPQKEAGAAEHAGHQRHGCC